MEFLIADSFTTSLARLTGDEQKAVKTTAFDLQMNPAAPGLSFHKLDAVRDKRFWSVRVDRDIRLIVHRTEDSLLLCYVDHHDRAYDWAARRKLETHPKTGAAQLVEIRETVQEIIVPRFVEVDRPAPPRPPIFARYSDDDLLGYGVPPEWLDDVRRATEDSVLALADHLPAEAAEALLELATGGRPKAPAAVAIGVDPFAHPDAQRRFRVMKDVEELERALEFPWDRWTVFLHPAQRQLVERQYNGPARVAGSAGTGKTIVALHRAVYLARNHPDSRVLLTTFSENLAHALRSRLRRLISNEPALAERLDVQAIDAVGTRLYERRIGRPRIASAATLDRFLKDAASAVSGLSFTPGFLASEWSDLVDAWQLDSWEAYRDVRRLGRKTRLPEAQRAQLWSVFESVQRRLAGEGLVTWAGMFTRLATVLTAEGSPPYDFVVVDEAQDVSVAQLRLLAALGGGRSNALFFAGDLGQRIFQTPFSWKALGVDVRGRARTLTINYRTSHQIRMQADRLLSPEVADVDGNTEERRGTVSVFNGPLPVIRTFNSVAEEGEAVAGWLTERVNEGTAPGEIGVFVRSEDELERARTAVGWLGLPCTELDLRTEIPAGHTAISTMHLAKGLEFRAVVVMACDDEVIPKQSRIEGIVDDADLDEVYNTERHLLYVACTRARDHLLVTGVNPTSEFLADLSG